MEYDLITIGAGSGGVAASRRASQHGAKVAICESERVGGTCVLRGCVPKKLLVYTSRFAQEFKDARGFGWQLKDAPTLDWPTLIARKDAELDRLNQIYLGMLERSQVQLHLGQASFLDPHTVQVGDQTLRGKHILIASGSRPHRPASIAGRELALTSREFLQLPTLPKSVAIIGAGFIGVEFASLLVGLGVSVDLFCRSTLLRGFDEDIQSHLSTTLREQGLRIHERCSPHGIEATGEQYRLAFPQAAPASAATLFDKVVLATGRTPNTEALKLPNAGLSTNASGYIDVDGWSQTKIPHIYAVGDVTGRIELTPVAIADGRAVAETLFNENPTPSDHNLVASAVFSTPPAATVGLTQAQARAAGHDLRVFKTSFRPMRNTLAQRQDRIMMKLLVDRASDRVLGCHMVGPDAPEIIQSLAVALRCGATKTQFDQTMAVHPTASEEFVTMYQESSS